MDRGARGRGVSAGERIQIDNNSTADDHSVAKDNGLSQSEAEKAKEKDQGLGRPAFPSMAEPPTSQVGHYMFLRCGHNGNFLNVERKVYERHLIRAGIITNEEHNGRLSD